MIRAFFIATILAAGLAAPALAGDEPATDAASAAAFTAQQTAVANQQQIRKLLAAQGYVVTSDLYRDDAGRWVGTALKDGKQVRVAIKMPPRNAPTALTN